MTIKRVIDGKNVEIELTDNEKSLAYEEIRHSTWEHVIREQIEKNSENLRFTEDFNKEDFFEECMTAIEDMYYADDYDEKAEDIVFDQSESYGIWVDGCEEDDADEV